jgi:DNA-binding IclR family transcriptional regulator
MTATLAHCHQPANATCHLVSVCDNQVMQKECAGEGSDRSSSAGKALTVLGVFTGGCPEWGASEVAKELSITVPTAHRLLTVLADHGYLARVGRGRFRLGLESISLGRRALASIDLRSVLRPTLQALAAESGETALLTVPDEREHASLCIDRVESTHPLRLSLEVGRLTPLTAGASAKALLAFLPPKEIQVVLDRPKVMLAPGTITDPEALLKEFAEIRRRGYATSKEETDASACGVAAPIRSSDGYAVAAIGLAGPLSRLSDRALDEFGALVRTAASEAELRLGARANVNA